LKLIASALALSALCLAQAPQYATVATAKHIMNAVQKPGMDSLVAMNKAGGPKDDKEWELAEQQAAMMAETAQLLLMGGRPKDEDVWVKSAVRLQTAATDAAKAAHDKNLEAWKASFTAVGGSCRSCHNVHRPKKQQPAP